MKPRTAASASVSKIFFQAGSTHLQHVQQGCLSGVIETEEQEFGMFVEQTQGCESIPDYTEAVCQLVVLSSSPKVLALFQFCKGQVATYTS